jgi:hypothetical protein
MLKPTVAEDSPAEYRLTGTETSPNEMVAELIGRGGMSSYNLTKPNLARRCKPKLTEVLA